MGKIKDFLNLFRHRYYEFAKVLMFVIAVVLVFWQLPRVGKFRYEFQLYKPWQHESFYAPFDFPIYKDAEMLKVENEEVLKSVKPVFQFDLAKTQEARAKLEDSFEIQWHGESTKKEANKTVLMDFFDQIQDRGVVAYDKGLSDIPPERLVSLVKDKTASTVAFGSLFTMNSAREEVEQWVKQPHPGIDKNLVSSLLLNVLHQNVVYDAAMTKREQDKALSKGSRT